MATGRIDRSPRRRARSSGRSSSVSIPVVMRLRVVSEPAFCSSRKNTAICIWFNRSPSISAWSSTDMRSSRGCVDPVRAHRVGVRVHRLRGLAALLGGGVGVEAERELRPVEDLLAVLLGNADQVGDGVQRQPQCDVAHEVALAPLGDRIDHRVDPSLHLRGQVVDPPGREPGRDQLAQLRVVGRVEADHQQRRAGSRRPARRRRAGTGWVRCGSRSSRGTPAARRRDGSPPSSHPARRGGPGARPGRGRAARGRRRTGTRARTSPGGGVAVRRRCACSCSSAPPGRAVGYRRPTIPASRRSDTPAPC